MNKAQDTVLKIFKPPTCGILCFFKFLCGNNYLSVGGFLFTLSPEKSAFYDKFSYGRFYTPG